jgi:uncharacterized protein YdiU (UPF0061 family)
MSPHRPAAGWNLDHSYGALPGVFHRRIDPTAVRAPRLVILNHALGDALGLELASLPDDEVAALLAGNALPPGARPLAQAYAGHQFGHFTMLGDGRAILLGEQLAPDGTRHDIQFKGAGRTPFSRGGDGRAALGPMLREYLISEAMHALGIPTTRSLAVVATGEPVLRDGVLQGAVLTRTAASHLRVGTFEYAAGLGDRDALARLADYAIARHDPELVTHPGRYLALLEAVIARQARLVAAWMQVGFVHGVMNTDNMTLSGETIDYGPCAFMDRHALETVFSSIDRRGRYAYGNQPRIAQWNLARLAEALLPLLADSEPEAIERAQAAIEAFDARFDDAWLTGMRRKLGLASAEPGDLALVRALLQWMQQAGADHTGTFRDLIAAGPPAASRYREPEFLAWHAQWSARLARQPGGAPAGHELMRGANPVVVPRNHKVEEALAAAGDGDLQPFRALLEAVREPFAEAPSNHAYRDPPLVPDPGYRTFCGT